MKFFLSTLLFYIICLSTNSQTFVSTTPENKNIVLEEFTGISCTYCPDGHRIANDLYNNNPSDVVLINVHTGGYASPQGPGTDFNTIFGSSIAGQSNLSGYPAGSLASLRRAIVANARNYSCMEIDQIRLLNALETAKGSL